MVKNFFKCRENGIDRLRNGKLPCRPLNWTLCAISRLLSETSKPSVTNKATYQKHAWHGSLWVQSGSPSEQIHQYPG